MKIFSSEDLLKKVERQAKQWEKIVVYISDERRICVYIYTHIHTQYFPLPYCIIIIKYGGS